MSRKRERGRSRWLTFELPTLGPAAPDPLLRQCFRISCSGCDSCVWINHEQNWLTMRPVKVMSGGSSNGSLDALAVIVKVKGLATEVGGMSKLKDDFSSQHIFEARHERGEKPVDEFSGIHGVLKRFVHDGQLWYVLLHTAPERVEKAWFSRYVILFAVGKSPNGNRLVGVVTHQVCHNLCD
jgi:hypothetical protein